MAVSLYVDSVYGASQTRFAGATNADLKSIDDITTAQSIAPVTRGQRSFVKHISGRLLGTWTSILSGHVYRDGSISGALNKTVIFGCPTIGYRGPTNGALGGTVLAGASAGATNGPNPTLTLGFGNSEGNATHLAASNNLGSTVFTNFLCLQLQTTPSSPLTAVPSSSYKFVISEN